MTLAKLLQSKKNFRSIRLLFYAIWIFFVSLFLFRFSFTYEPLNAIRNVLLISFPIYVWLLIEQIDDAEWKKLHLPSSQLFTVLAARIFAVIAIVWCVVVICGSDFKRSLHGIDLSRRILKTALISNKNIYVSLESIQYDALPPNPRKIELTYTRHYFNFLKESITVSSVVPGISADFTISADGNSLLLKVEPAGSRTTKFIQNFSTDWDKVVPVFDIHSYG